MTTSDRGATKPKTIGEMSRSGSWSRGSELPQNLAEAEAQLVEHVIALAARDGRFAPLVALAQGDPSLAVRIAGAVAGATAEARRILRDYPEQAWILDECRTALEPLHNAARWARSSVYLLAAAHDLLRGEVADAAFDRSNTPESERTDEARDALATEIASWVRDRIDALGFGNDYTLSPSEEDGMLRLDARFAAELERIDGTQTIVEAVREAARERAAAYEAGSNSGTLYSLWCDPGAPGGAKYLQALGFALWRDRVRKRIKARSGAIATLPAFVFNDLHSIAGARDVEREKTSDGRDAPPPARIYAGGSATELALTTLDGFREVTLERFHELAESPLFWPTLHWITSTVRDQEIEGRQDAHIIRIEGGDDGLRRAVAPNASKDRGAATIREILECFHLLGSAAKPGHPRLLTFIQRKIPAGPSGGRPSTLSVIEVGLLMRHNAAHRLGLDVPAWFLPVFDPALIPTVGDHRTYGRQINAGQSLSLYAHEHREEIASDGSFRLTKDQWIGVANKAGLYYRTHASLRDRYLDALQEPPHPQRALAFGRVPGTEPMLVRIGPDRYRFGDSFGPEWEHFVAQGNRTLAKRRQGRDARAKRDSRLASLAEKEKRRPKG